MGAIMRKVLICFIFLVLGVALMRTQFPSKINQISAVTTNSTFHSMNIGTDDENFFVASGFVGEVLIASLIFISPLSIIGGVWFAKLSLQILFSESLRTSFALPDVFLFIFGIFGILLFFYSFYISYKALEKGEIAKEFDKQDVSKLI